MKKYILALFLIMIGSLSFSSANIQKGASYGYLCEYDGDNMVNYYNEMDQEKTFCGFIEIDGNMYNFYIHMINADNIQVKFIDQIQDKLVEYQYFGSGGNEYVYKRYTDLQDVQSNIVERGNIKIQILAGTGSLTFAKKDTGGYDSIRDDRMLRLYNNFNIFDGLGYLGGNLDSVDILFAGSNGAGNIEIGNVLYEFKNNNTQQEIIVGESSINSSTTHPYYSIVENNSSYNDVVNADGSTYTNVANFTTTISGYLFNNQFKQTLSYSGDTQVKTNNLFIKYDGNDYICNINGYNKDGNKFNTYYNNQTCGYVNESQLLSFNQDNLYTTTTSADTQGTTCQNLKIKPLDGLLLTNTGDLKINNNTITLDITGYNNILSGLDISFNSKLAFDKLLTDYDLIMTEKKTFIKTFSERSLSNYITERDGIDLKNVGVTQRDVEVWNTNTNNKITFGMNCTTNGYYDINANGNNLITGKGIEYGYRQSIESFTGSYPDNFTVDFFKIQYYKIKNSDLLILGKQLGNTSTSDLNTKKEIKLSKQEKKIGQTQAGNIFDDIFSCDRNDDGSISITYELPACPITIGSNASTVVVSGINNISTTMSLLGELGNVDQQNMSNATGTFSNVTIAGMSGHTDGLGRFVIIIKRLAYMILFIVLIIYIFS